MSADISVVNMYKLSAGNPLWVTLSDF